MYTIINRMVIDEATHHTFEHSQPNVNKKLNHFSKHEATLNRYINACKISRTVNTQLISRSFVIAARG